MNTYRIRAFTRDTETSFAVDATNAATLGPVFGAEFVSFREAEDAMFRERSERGTCEASFYVERVAS